MLSQTGWFGEEGEMLRPSHISVSQLGRIPWRITTAVIMIIAASVIMDHLICVFLQSTSYNPHDNPLRWVFYPHFADEEAKD